MTFLSFNTVQGAAPKIPIQTSDLSTSAPASPSFSSGFEVRFHPDGGLYIGDQVSIEIFSPAGLNLTTEDLQTIHVEVVNPIHLPLGDTSFSPSGADGQLLATFKWIWDTKDLTPGKYTLRFATAPKTYAWEETIDLLPAADLPANQANAVWASVQTNCCVIHYITGTDAERDIDKLKQMVDEETTAVLDQFNTTLDAPVQITFMPRVMGQGGFTSDEIYISYLDRNYAGSTTRQVLHHELVHLVDAKLGGEYRPLMFVEGLAVYLSGGHFKPEPLMERAAFLQSLGEYTPLSELANDFYSHQHEAGYLEAASLIQYMVETYGWDNFNAFYRGIQKPQNDQTDSQVIDAAMQEHFGLTLDQMEQQFQQKMADLNPDPKWKEDVSLSIRFYDTVRRYQQDFDTSAYFRQLWLPSPKEMRDRGIVADYLRHPDGLENRILETLLVTVDVRLRAGDYTGAEQLLSKVNQTLDRSENLLPYYALFHISSVEDLPTAASLP